MDASASNEAAVTEGHETSFAPSDEQDKLFQCVVSLCRSWLQYQSPSMQKAKIEGIAVKAQRYDKEGGQSGMGMGPYLYVLREAQFHWAAKALPPMQARAAFLRRQERQAWRVAIPLGRFHRTEWNRWTESHPDRSVNALMDEIAVLMAHRLGGELL